jgi:membrane-bound lytic murein transglycosylase D
MKISKLFLTFSLALCCSISFQTYAQTVEEESQVVSEEVEEVAEESKIQYPFTLQVTDSRDGKVYQIIMEDPALIEKRLQEIQQTMPLVYNESVKQWLDFFMLKRPSFTQEMMEKKDFYFPTFEKYLKANNMPEELKYLALLESGLNPKAVSRSKAVGLWQFMSFTGKEMGLTINDYVDERMHIDKSTDAACKYLRTLYRMFDDWDLALASYNTGPGRIRRTIKSTGLNNYWDLHPHIHRDTRAYVPQFIALNYLMHYGNDHGIYPSKKLEFVDVEKIPTSGYMDLKTLANLSCIDMEEIKALNPHIKTTYLPESFRGYEISLPAKKLAYFNANRAYILDSASRQFNKVEQVIQEENPTILASNQDDLNDGTIVIGRKTFVPELVVNKNTSNSYTKVTKTVKKYHKVRKGEFLSKIASKYGVTMSEVKKWNHMRSSKVLAGERLVIYVTETQKVKSNSLAAKSPSENIKTNYHTVKHGDTLWNISQRYDGVTIDDIKKWNNMSGNTVKVGQKIKIKS